MRNRTVVKYSCNGVGRCVAAAPTIENDSAGCVRETDGTTCTDDGNRCDGAEKCKNGNCVPDNVDPCKGNASNPYCFNSDPTCRVCKATNASGSTFMGTCASGQYCCGGSCSNSKCLIVATIINPTIIQTTIIQTAAAAP
jgi:hypothetical protein